VLNKEFGLISSLKAQLGRTYSFGDVLVARAGTRVTAVSASTVPDIERHLAVTLERMTGIEPALSAWEFAESVRIIRLEREDLPPWLPVRHRSSPFLMAR
jgi:hypothetical protein